MSPQRPSNPRSPTHAALGAVITEIRDEAGLTLEEFAELTKMRFQLISELERARTDPRLSTLVRLSRGADIELSELFARLEQVRDR